MLQTDEQVRIIASYLKPPEPGEAPPDTSQLDPVQFSGNWAPIAHLIKRGMIGPEITKILDPEQLRAVSGSGIIDTDTLTRALLAKRWTLLGIDTLLQPPRPPTYLLADMIRLPSLTVVYGAPGTLKSMLLMDLAVCVAGGGPWLDPLPTAGKGGHYLTKQGPVLFVDCDNGQNRLKERFGALYRGHNPTGTLPLSAISLANPPIDLLRSTPGEINADTQSLKVQIEDLGACMVVIDNLGTISGGAEENSSEMVAIMANLRYVAEATGAAVFVIHHARKGGSNGGREGDRLRGHSSIEASLDLALLVERELNNVTIQSTKTRDDPVKPFEVVWTFDKDATGALDKARFWHVKNTEEKASEYVTIGRDLAEFLDTLDAPVTQGDLRKAIRAGYDCGDKAARLAIDWAEQDGQILGVKQGTRPNATLHYSAVSTEPTAAKLW